MYGDITGFISHLSGTNPILWAILVVASIFALALVLYGFWEMVLWLLVRLSRDGPPRG